MRFSFGFLPRQLLASLLVIQLCVLVTSCAIRSDPHVRLATLLIRNKVMSFENKETVILPTRITAVRGGRIGKVINAKRPEGVTTKFKNMLASVQPVTRNYLLLVIFCTLVHLTGLPAPKYFALNSNKLWQLWRPFTSVAYFGGPSMSMANSIYFLIQFGQKLEHEYGPGTHAWFLVVQAIMLSILGMLLNFPFQSQSMIAAIVYVCSRLNALESVAFQFGIVIRSWQLPYCLMIIDCLSKQSPSAAWPHVLGIFTGHVYYFFTQVWPKLGGKSKLTTPSLFTKLFGDKSMSNVPGMKIRKQEEEEDGSKSSSKSGITKLFKKKASKGRKLT